VLATIERAHKELERIGWEFDRLSWTPEEGWRDFLEEHPKLTD
jgi:hypothetical protein